MLPAQQPGPRRVPGRRTWRSRIGLALLLVSVCAIALVVWRHVHIRRQAHLQRISSQILSRGGRIERGLTEFQGIYRQWFSDTLVVRPDEGVIRKVKLIRPTAEELEVVSRMTTLHELEIECGTLSLDLLRTIPRLRKMYLLELMLESFGDEDGGRLAEALQKLPKFTRLRIHRSTLTNQGLNSLLGLKNLNELVLSDSRVTGEAIENTQVMHFDLLANRVSDATLDRLLSHAKFGYLSLSSPSVSREKLFSLQTVPNVRLFDLTGMKMTEEELKRFSLLYPTIEIRSGNDYYKKGTADGW